MKTVPSVVLSKMLDYDDVYDSESPMSLYYVITEYTDTAEYQYRYTNFDDVLEHLAKYKHFVARFSYSFSFFSQNQ
jgi:hypothetical protein